MQKYDKSLIEVWEWKDKVYQDFKDLTIDEYVKKVRAESEAIMGLVVASGQKRTILVFGICLLPKF